MREFTIKRGSARKPETWHLTKTALSRKNKTIVLSDVTEVLFEQAIMGWSKQCGFKLVTAKKSYSIWCSQANNADQLREFLSMCAATVEQLEKNGSHAKIRKSRMVDVYNYTVPAIFLGMGIYFVWTMSTIGSTNFGNSTRHYISYAIGALIAFVYAIFKKAGQPKPVAITDLHGLLAKIRDSFPGEAEVENTKPVADHA